VQLIKVSIVQTKQPIRSREIWCAINERTLIGSNPAGISNDPL